MRYFELLLLLGAFIAPIRLHAQVAVINLCILFHDYAGKQ